MRKIIAEVRMVDFTASSAPPGEAAEHRADDAGEQRSSAPTSVGVAIPV
jgi:hypothetical protein